MNDGVIEDARAVPEGRMVIYVLRDGTGQALYVGQTGALRRRLLQHRRASEWWASVASVDHVPTIEGSWAHADEARCITVEQPLFNRTLGGRGCTRRPRYSDDPAVSA